MAISCSYFNWNSKQETQYIRSITFDKMSLSSIAILTVLGNALLIGGLVNQHQK